MSLIHSFGVNKTDHLQRSKIDFNMRKRCEFRQGALIPLVSKFIIPNSTWSCNANCNVRLLLTPARPFMGDMYFTYGFYFVPLRILFKDYVKMFGNGEPVDWQNPTEWILPTMTFDIAVSSKTVKSAGTGYDAVVPGGISVNNAGEIVSVPGSLANYLALPATRTNSTKKTVEVNLAKEAAYLSIWNTFWRDENYQNSDPDVSKIFSFSGGSYGTRSTLSLSLHYANAFHDYFTSLLPNTQKGPSATAFSHLVCLPNLYTMEYLPGDDPSDVTIKFGDQNKNAYANTQIAINSSGDLVAPSTSSVSSTAYVRSTNLGVDITVDKLRMAFATQRARERDARTGNRFVEAMLGIFEARLPNAVADMPEFLGGNTIQLNLTSVPATAKTTDASTGSMGAFSFTRDNSGAFVKTFDEPGILMAVGCVRIKRVYSQGIERDRLKTRRFDFYDPCFAHINEQPVWHSQLLAFSNVGNLDVLGFNEAWAEDIKPVDEVCGLMGDPEGPIDLHKWNLLHFHTGNTHLLPVDYLPEKFDEVANACVDYNTSYPTWVFGLDFHANCKVTAPRPVYAIPGLIDHLIA